MTESMRRIKRVSASILAEKLHEANAPSSYTLAPLASTTPSTTTPVPGASADASSTFAPTITHPYSAVQPSDAQANGKRDIMSLLVRARKAQVDRDILAATAGEKGGPAVNTKGYTMSDSAMMDQVVRTTFTPLRFKKICVKRPVYDAAYIPGRGARNDRQWVGLGTSILPSFLLSQPLPPQTFPALFCFYTSPHCYPSEQSPN